MYLRPYQAKDFEAIFALDRLCFAPPFRFSKALMREVVSRQGGFVSLACELDDAGSERLLGFCAVNFEDQGRDRIAYVSTLDVTPASRGQGVGRALMQDLERAAEKAGAIGMGLHVSATNEAAIRLYESLSYLRQERQADFYGVGLDAWSYWKQFAP